MNLHAAARAVLAETAVEAKLAATAALHADWLAGRLCAEPWTDPEPLQEAGRPPRPVLVEPQRLPRRELDRPDGHAALIHALAHIEFTAINLAVDAVYRFPGLPQAYYADWLGVAAEEALHFRLLRDHLRTLGHDYGDFPAHGGLWAVAQQSVHDPLLRMALVPRLMEARGLDVTPGLRRKLLAHGDQAGAAILQRILHDEIGHVAAGDRWFRFLCQARGLEPARTWRALIGASDVPKPRPPFNVTARQAAGFDPSELAGW
ncbi:MAG: ferritin-like domain-containing protein [Thiobacillaceae bacterium]|nr:ferritin-like domain-containing protein [Thiobacillaceae bacterium]MCX7672036.1 ferritin-like domain-containing protein [Thiobacillaceae bacterium]MDW8323728.1 ferritin-like domain-containing protein [Burkholderiales bacterium]